MLDGPPRLGRAAGSPARRASTRIAAVAALAIAALAAVSGAPPAGAAKKPRPVVSIVPGELTVYRVGDAPPTLPDSVRDKVMATLGAYVNAATVRPLQKGTVDDAALAGALGPSVTARLGGPDRAVLLDEGVPRATKKIVVAAAPVALTGLADAQGNVVVVTAGLDATTTTKTEKGKVSIKRTGELVLTPEADTWKITGYTLTVDRIGRGLGAPATPTATAAPTAPAAPAQGSTTR
ncbi:MAG: hypothetical protein AMXMBFR46_11970 [Acidimicrobiia bacterium]